MIEVAPTWAESLPADRLLFTVFYAMVGCRCWANRHHVAALNAWLRKAVSTYFARQRFHSDTCSSDTAADDAWVQAQTDKMRVRNFRCISEVMSVASMVVVMILSLLWSSIDETPYRRNCLTFVALQISLSAVVLSVSCDRVQLTASRARCGYVVLNGLSMVRMLAASPTPYFYIMNALTAIARACGTIAILDTRLSCAVNAVWACANIYQEVCKQPPLSPNAPLLNSPVAFVGIELGMFTIMQGCSCFAGVFVESHVRLNLGVIVAGNVQQAVRRLLSVLCDAELSLTPSLEIRDPSHKVAYLLAPDAGAAGVAAVEGRGFADFVADADQERFRAFLSASTGATSAGAEPPRSTQVELRDSTGCSVPVEVFHANLPDVQSGRKPGHLLGIRECATARKETSALAEPRGPTLGPGCPRPPLQSAAGPDAALQGREGGQGQPLQGLLGREANGGAPDDEAASAPSERSSRSIATLVRRLDLPELGGIEIRFDALSEEMVVKELRCRFAAHPTGPADPAAATPQHMPMLPDWIHASMRKALQDWLQENLNAVCNGRECSSSFGPLLLQWPSREDAGEEALMVEAAEVALDVPDSDEEGSEEGAEAEEEGMDAVLKLRNFQQVSMRPGRHRRPRSVRGHKQRSLHSCGRGGQQLPSIEEAAARNDADASR